MDRQDILKSLRREVNKSYDRFDYLRKVEQLFSEMGESFGNIMSNRLEEIAFNLNRTLTDMEQNNDLKVSKSGYNYIDLGVTHTQTKAMYQKSKIANTYMTNMARLVELEKGFKEGTVSSVNAIKEIIHMNKSLIALGVNNVRDDNLYDMNNGYCAFGNSIYKELEKNLTPEDIKEINSSKSELKDLFSDSELDFVLNANEKMLDQAKEIKKLEKEDRSFSITAEDIIAKFKKLDSILDSNSYSGRVRFDPQEVMYALGALEDSVYDLGRISNAKGNSRDSEFYRYIDEMSSTFSERTHQTRSALADFQTSTFENQIPLMKNLLENMTSSEERSAAIVKFTKSAGWYMNSALIIQGQNSEHVESVMREVNEVIKFANEVELAASSKSREVSKSKKEEVKNQTIKQESVKENEKNQNVSVTESTEKIEETKEEIKPTEQLKNEPENINSNEKVEEEKKQEEVERHTDPVVVMTKQEEMTAASEVDKKEPDIGLSESDYEQLNTAIKQFGKYEWVKHSLLYNLDFKISKQFREILENDSMKGHIEEMCDLQPQHESEGDLPFIDSEITEIKGIIKQLYKDGYSKDEIVKAAAFEIKNNGSKGLQETWATLNSKFNGENQLYYYVAREYLQNVANEIFNEMEQNKNKQVSSSDKVPTVGELLESVARKAKGNPDILKEEFKAAAAQYGVDLSSPALKNMVEKLMEDKLKNLASKESTSSQREEKETIANNQENKHPLDKYKELLEKYDVKLVSDAKFPNGRFVVTDRSTGQIPTHIPPEQRPALTKDLAFIKSWVSACGADLSLSGGKNEFGYDPRQWEYAFNDGAKGTFDTIVTAIQNTTGPHLSEKVKNYVSQSSNYKYADSIANSLLDNGKNKLIIDNIHERLLAEAGLSAVRIEGYNNEDLGMNL